MLRFGVSGLLRNSDLVMWDDRTVSLWQQVTGEAIVGTATGTVLDPVPTAIVSFGDFAASYPEGVSLARESGVGGALHLQPVRGLLEPTRFRIRSTPARSIPATGHWSGSWE